MRSVKAVIMAVVDKILKMIQKVNKQHTHTHTNSKRYLIQFQSILTGWLSLCAPPGGGVGVAVILAGLEDPLPGWLS